MPGNRNGSLPRQGEAGVEEDRNGVPVLAHAFSRHGLFAGLDHEFRLHQGVEVVLRHVAKSERFFTERRSIVVGRFRDVRRLVITDLRRECRHQHEGAFKQILDALLIRNDAGDAIVGETPGRVGDQPDRLKKIANDDRLKDR